MLSLCQFISSSLPTHCLLTFVRVVSWPTRVQKAFTMSSCEKSDTRVKLIKLPPEAGMDSPCLSEFIEEEDGIPGISEELTPMGVIDCMYACCYANDPIIFMH
jgi:hypothetical protein